MGSRSSKKETKNEEIVIKEVDPNPKFGEKIIDSKVNNDITYSNNFEYDGSPAGIKQQLKHHSILSGKFDVVLGYLKKSANEQINLIKIYTATIDGDTNLHKFIDRKGPTVMIISANGQMFGAYTSLSWKTNEGFLTDKEAFLFSVTDNIKLPIDQGKNYWAIYAVDKAYTYFGYPCDLIIQYDFLRNTTNQSKNTNGTYPSTSGKFLAGSEFFMIDELEVFKVERNI